MGSRIISAILFMAMACLAAPKTYSIKKCPQGNAPVINGNAGDWAEDYFIDTLYSDDNCYARDGNLPWTPAEFQMRCYAAYDSEKIYFALVVITDDDYMIGEGAGADIARICLGKELMAIYINSDESITAANPTSPFTLDSSYWIGSRALGNDSLPTYEFAVLRSIYDPFKEGAFKLSIGTVDVDAGDQAYYLAIGAEYTGNKQNWNACPWDDTLYYPTFNLVDIEGPLFNPPFNFSVEKYEFPLKTGSVISANPSPFVSTTTLSYSTRTKGAIRIYDINGKSVTNMNTAVGSGKVLWNGKDANGRHVSAGVYVARLECGANTSETRILIIR